MAAFRPLVVLLLAALPVCARSQSNTDSSSDRSGPRGLELWAGYSAKSPKWGVLGNRPGMSLAIAAARYTRRISDSRSYSLDYTFDVVPLALVSPPLGCNSTEIAVGNCAAPDGSCLFYAFSCVFPNGSAYGAGFSPLGITAIYRRSHAFQPRLGATGGALFFDRRVPTVLSTRFNFTATIEAGAQILAPSGDGILLVYRFHHLSNAGTGYDNSAIASHVISIGARLHAPLWRRNPLPRAGEPPAAEPAPGLPSPQPTKSRAVLPSAPGSVTAVRLDPSSFPGMPIGVRLDLERRACRIPQVPGDSTPHNVISARFFGGPSNDWAVLCSSSGTSRILVYKAGDVVASDSLAPERDDRLMQSHAGGPPEFSRRIMVETQSLASSADSHPGIADVLVEKAYTIWHFEGARWTPVPRSGR